MNSGKIVFSQVIDHLPLHHLRQSVSRYRGNHKVKQFSCYDQFLSMVFAQLTYRESLRDIEACLRAQKSKLYHMGIRGGISRNTLANANKVRDWRIYADFAQILIGIARNLYRTEYFGVELDETVYALDSTTIDLSLSTFPLGSFPVNQGSGQTSYTPGSARQYPDISINQRRHIARRQYLGRVDSRTWQLLCHGSGLSGFCSSLCPEPLGLLFRYQSKVKFQIRPDLFSPGRQGNRPALRSNSALNRFLFSQGLPGHVAPRKVLRRRKRQATGFFDKQLFSLGSDYRGPLSMSLAGGAVFQMDKAEPPNQVVFRHFGKCRQNSNMDSRISLCRCCDHKETVSN